MERHTERKDDSLSAGDGDAPHVQRELRRQLRILHALGSSSPDFMYIFDRDQRFIYASPPLLKLWGKTLNEVTGKNFHDLGYPPDLVALHRGQINEALTGVTVSGSNSYVSPEGHEGHYEYTFVPVVGDDGQIESVVGTTRDVTSKIKIEQERAEALRVLQESETQLRHFADSIPQLAWMARSDGHIFWYNRRWYEYTGTTAEEMDGWGWQRVHDPETLPEVLATWRESLANANPFEMAFPLRSATGEFRRFLTRVLPIRNASGDVVLWFGTNTDIEAHHQALSQRDAALAAAEEASRAKDQFLAMLGHELRNPLAPIVTALKLLQMRGASGREYDVIDRQVKHLSHLVDDLLDIARIAQGTLQLRKTNMDVCHAIRHALEMAGPLLEKRSQSVSLELPPRGLYISADFDRLAQVVTHLLSNAAKFSAVGASISIQVEETPDAVQIKVRDQGIGISADRLQHIFGSFVQQPQSIDRSGGGLGLGLSIVQNLVQLHGGSVSAQSDGPGTGSEFIIKLPSLTATSPAALSLSDGMGTTERRRGRVLIVDDNRDAADLLAEFMASIGFTVDVAYDPPDALAKAATFRPNIALLDIGLPVMDGWELGRRLRALLGDRVLTLIAVTGYGQEGDRRVSQDSGFAGHLVKPVDLNTLSALVHNYA